MELVKKQMPGDAIRVAEVTRVSRSNPNQGGWSPTLCHLPSKIEQAPFSPLVEGPGRVGVGVEQGA